MAANKAAGAYLKQSYDCCTGGSAGWRVICLVKPRQAWGNSLNSAKGPIIIISAVKKSPRRCPRRVPHFLFPAPHAKKKGKDATG